MGCDHEDGTSLPENVIPSEIFREKLEEKRREKRRNDAHPLVEEPTQDSLEKQIAERLPQVIRGFFTLDVPAVKEHLLTLTEGLYLKDRDALQIDPGQDNGDTGVFIRFLSPTLQERCADAWNTMREEENPFVYDHIENAYILYADTHPSYQISLLMSPGY